MCLCTSSIVINDTIMVSFPFKWNSIPLPHFLLVFCLLLSTLLWFSVKWIKRKHWGHLCEVEFLPLLSIPQPEYRSEVSNDWGKCCFQQGKRVTQQGADTAWKVTKETEERTGESAHRKSVRAEGIKGTEIVGNSDKWAYSEWHLNCTLKKCLTKRLIHS